MTKKLMSRPPRSPALPSPATVRATAVDMQAKAQPLQERSRATYEAILAAAASLLEEVGIDSLSTNLICARANLTPPALYRYFPNKYALLRELGIRLMQVQDQVVFDWIAGYGLQPTTLEEAFEQDFAVQKRVVEITRAQPASLWIARAMRAVPMLREVRTESREKVVDAVFKSLRSRYHETSDETLRLAVRLNIELCSAAIEMIIEEPDKDADKLMAELSWMMVRYFMRFK
jgi:AcrR family transcriptional regulator